MAAPTKPVKTSDPGELDNPIYARTSVLCNGQIAWKVGSAKDMEYLATDARKAELRPTADVTEDLIALNGLQMYRAKPLTPLEVKQPLRHVQSSLPKAVKDRIYTGDLYGSAKGVFSCTDDKFAARAKRVFKNEVRADGDMNYNDFFRRLRRSEWLLWDVEAEEGRWVAVIAHLYKSTIRNPNKKLLPDNDDIPASITSPQFNKIDEWCVVTAQRSPEGDAMVDRVKNRLPTILKEGKIGIDENSEVPAIWVPMDETNWSSGLRVYALIRTLMHRITDLYCKNRRHQPTFWYPVSGWLNVDEVRAEMQGRAAQRCMAATDYRSRIAIEGVHRWIGRKEVVLAKELKPRYRDNQAYSTGKDGEDGRSIPVGPYNPDSDSSDDGPNDDGPVDNGLFDDEEKGPAGQSEGGQDIFSTGWHWEEEDPINGGSSKPTSSKKKGKKPIDVNKLGGPFKLVTPLKTPGGGFQKQAQKKFNKIDFTGPLPSPPSKVHGWNDDSMDDDEKLEELLKWKWESIKADINNSEGPSKPTHQVKGAKKTASHTQHKFNKAKFSGPLDTPPSKIDEWYDEGIDHVALFPHINLTVQAELEASKKSIGNTSQAQETETLWINSDPMFTGPLPSPPSNVGWDSDSTDNNAQFQHINLTKAAEFKKWKESKGKATSQAQETETLSNDPMFTGPLPSPPSNVGWDDDSTDDGFQHINLTVEAKFKKWKKELKEKATSQAQKTQTLSDDPMFTGPLPTPPSEVDEWNDNDTDYEGLGEHIPLTRPALFKSWKAEQAGSKSVKGTGSKPTKSDNQQSQAKQDKKRKRKQSDKHEKKKAKQKKVIASTDDESEPGVKDLLSILDPSTAFTL